MYLVPVVLVAVASNLGEIHL